jgi:nicotinamidase/pyrazinamidase
MRTALLVVDCQYDFLPNGALAVSEGFEVLAPLEREIARAREEEREVICSLDFHPTNHCSFVEQGGPWPPHCVIGTHGANIHAAIRNAAKRYTSVVKGVVPELEAYSAFDGLVGESTLRMYLRDRGVDTVRVGGLATDYCVRATVIDALELGFGVVLLRDCIRGVNVRPDDSERAIEEMVARGATVA